MTLGSFTLPSRTRLSFIVLVVGLLATNCLAAEKAGRLPAEASRGKVYSEAQLIYDFGLIAFSSFISYESPDFGLFNQYSYENDKSSLFNREVFKSYYPWLYEYLYRDQGEPKYVAINKWTQPIRIELGYPNNLEPNIPLVGKALASGKTYPRINENGELINIPYLVDRTLGTVAESKIQAAQAAIRQSLPILEASTGLSISYNDSHDSLEKVGNIRVVLVDDVKYWETSFKKGKNVTFRPLGGSNLQVDFRDEIERFYLPTAVHFTPYLKQQVDGFFISNSKNEIGMSFCFISSHHDVELIKSLVSECLLRSLGLPDLSNKNPSSLLGFLRKDSNDPGISLFTDYDLSIIKMLYSPKIKPGMPPRDVFKALMMSNR